MKEMECGKTPCPVRSSIELLSPPSFFDIDSLFSFSPPATTTTTTTTTTPPMTRLH
jgi:hypothetical protein